MDEYKNVVMDYHNRQIEKPYRSTEVFVEWLKKKDAFKGDVLDIGAGGGANLKYMSQKFPDACFTGIEIDGELADVFNNNYKSDNARMIKGDAYKLKELDIVQGKVAGVVSFQFLSWLPELEPALEQMTALNPEWIAASALFFDGKVQYKIVIEDYNYPNGGAPYSKFYQHVYSLDVVREFFFNRGYKRFEYKKFEIDIDLPNVNPKYRGTYTVKAEDGTRLQISANMLMPWYFIFAGK